MPSVQVDFFILAITLAIGAALGLAHDCWQVLLVGGGQGLPRVRRRTPAATAGFWLCAVGLTWAVVMVAFAGQVRGFMFLGIGIGAVLYALVLSGGVRRALRVVRRSAIRLLSALIDAATAIVLFPVRLVSWLLGAAASLIAAVLAAPGRLVLAGVDRLAAMAAAALRAIFSAFRRPKHPQ